VSSSLRRFIRNALTKRVTKSNASSTRRITLTEEEPSDASVLMIILMVIFFVGLVGLEVTHMIWIGEWSEAVFNGIMLIVGTIVGAIWGKTTQ
jgi:hypothetical protein